MKPSEYLHSWNSYEGEPSGLRIAIYSSFSIDHFSSYLGASLVHDRFAINSIYCGQFGQMQGLAHDLLVNGQENIDYVIVMPLIHEIAGSLIQEYVRGNISASQVLDDEVVRNLISEVAAIAENSTSEIIAVTPNYTWLPEISNRDLGTLHKLELLDSAITQQYQDLLGEYRNVHLISLRLCLKLLNSSIIFDEKNRILFGQPFTSEMLLDLAKSISQYISDSTSQKKYKVLVVDCDNTLWGGVLGEDGIDGIQIGKGFPGQFFTDFQKELKYLKDSGYLLAIASKNNVDEVKDAIESNNQMVLKVDDFSVIKADWYEKSTMLHEIANDLNLGIESLVFIDDSDTEISEVSSALPTTRCIQIPKDVSELSGLLGSHGIWPPRVISKEDKVRTDLIKSENIRTEFKRTALSREQYLESLKLRVEVGLSTDSHVERVVQLINKTNQFNISTRRRSLVEVESLMSDETFRVYYLNASDRFGDYGLVGVLILKVINSIIEIDTFLLSCRILGREVEKSFLISAIVSEINVSVDGIEKVCAELIETPKNVPIRDFLPGLGFEKVASNNVDTTEYELDVDAFLELLVPSHIKVEVK